MSKNGFYRTSYLAAILLILHSCKAATAQTEHYLGGVAGKVTGPIYTLQHKRWNVTASGGWLTGFKGGYASVLGGYRVVSLLENFGYGDVKLLYGSGIGVDLGLGVFGLGYVAPTLRQRQLARELDYTTPFGVHFTGKVYFNVSPNCSYGMHIGIPLLMNPTEESIGYGDNSSRSVALWKGLLYIYQFSLQYKFSLG